MKANSQKQRCLALRYDLLLRYTVAGCVELIIVLIKYATNSKYKEC